MLGAVDHVGYLARDLDAAVERFTALYGSRVARHIDRPPFSLVGVYLGEGEGDIEIFTFTDPALLEQRLAGAEMLLDHVAYEVPDIDAIAAKLRSEGVRFAGPDLRSELLEPVDLGGVRHLWTVPQTSQGVCLQLLQR